MNNLLKIITDGEVEFDRKFGRFTGNDYRLPDLHKPIIKSDDIKSFQKSQTIKMLEGIYHIPWDKRGDEILSIINNLKKE